MKLFRFMAMLLVAASIGFTACESDDGGTPDVDVTFISAEQIGGTSGTVDSTGLILTFDVDPTTLTAEDITVTGATKGALTGSGTTRTLTISDITVADGEEVSVSIIGQADSEITGSPQTAVVYRLLAVGMPYQGGIITYILESYDPGYEDGAAHGLIAAAEDINISGTELFQWGGYKADLDETGYSTGEAIGDGKTNTDTIVNFFNSIHESADPYRSYYDYDWAGLTEGTVDFTDGTHIYAMDRLNNGSVAARLCYDYAVVDNGVTYDDWYLPSKNELNKLYLNQEAIGDFTDLEYWSSSEYSANTARYTDFDSGSQYITSKYVHYHVRAFRDF